MREWLLDGFRYDLWANRQWLPVAGCRWEYLDLPDTPEEPPVELKARLEDVFTHLLHGQRLWLERLDVRVVAQGEAWMDALHEGWMSVVRDREPSEIVRYVRPNGEEIGRPFGDIAWHLINHGTYHRGQLREIADQAGLEWPETDFTTWRSGG